MSVLNLQQIMSSRFRTSAAADVQTKNLMEFLGLSTKAAVARLAIGRSLSLGAFNGEVVDAKGLEIPAVSLFTQEDVTVWVGMILTHARSHGIILDGMDAFRLVLRQHWHRGVGLLIDDWQSSGENYDQFVGTLIKRRADLPDMGTAARANNTRSGTVVSAEDRSSQLAKALGEIGVSAEVKGVIHGPRLSRYKVALRDVNQLDKVRKGLERLALAMSLRDMMPTLGHGDEAKTVTIDVPRPATSWTTASKIEFLEALSTVSGSRAELMVCPGMTVIGEPVLFDLREAPHLLVGGATGQGKSVCIHAILSSLIVKHTPSTLQLALMDPKRVEFSIYAKSRFLWRDEIAIGPNAAQETLRALVEEMDNRYERMSALGVNNISDLAAKGVPLPFIVACVDELADLIMQDRSVEAEIIRLAQMARAAGIHLILATQRPDAKTFSGLIRSNIPARIALTVQKSSESQIILDESGAEDLLGKGDMIVKLAGSPCIRAHGYFLSSADVENIISR
jgi:DNA segregation ATPase FtsK/SpoIIIE, S-DNA-T family